MNLKGDGKMDFKDANKISSWAWDYVDGLSEKGIIKGANWSKAQGTTWTF